MSPFVPPGAGVSRARFEALACAGWLVVLLAGCAPLPPPRVLPPPVAADLLPAPPEVGTGWTEKQAVRSKRFMVAAANPLATDAGYQILRAGGSALDAAVAVQMVLALVEPQSSGIGGGAFLMHADARGAASVQAWDGRETAPEAADEKLFLGSDGKAVPFRLARIGGRAVGVPGAVRMLEAAHRQHGLLPWADLFKPAIRLAEDGFAMSYRLHTQLARDADLLQDPLARAYFFDIEGKPHAVGHRMQNPALAAVLRQIASKGSDALHQGPMAADLASRVQQHRTPGSLTAADLAHYQPRQRKPMCTDWLERYRVCGFPPPSSGHLAVMQILGLLERLPAVAQPLQHGVPGADWLHPYTEASRLAYADRAMYVADPDFVPAPAGDWHSLLDDAYLRQRAALVGITSMQRAKAGQPGGAPLAYTPMPEQPEQGTSHVSVVDDQGRAVAMTTTVETAFGAHLMADGGTGLPGGYLLNNQMTDFSLAPTDAQGRPVANRVQPGKRPRSSMSPTLVFDKRSGQLLMTLGSAFGPAIIHSTAKTLIASLQWGLDVQAAINLPNFGSFNGPTVLETGLFPLATMQALRERGHVVREMELTSGLQAIQRTPQGWLGGADPRREGAVRGD